MHSRSRTMAPELVLLNNAEVYVRFRLTVKINFCKDQPADEHLLHGRPRRPRRGQPVPARAHREPGWASASEQETGLRDERLADLDRGCLAPCPARQNGPRRAGGHHRDRQEFTCTRCARSRLCAAGSSSQIIGVGMQIRRFRSTRRASPFLMGSRRGGRRSSQPRHGSRAGGKGRARSSRPGQSGGIHPDVAATA